MSKLKPVFPSPIFIGGATASGKSAVALAIAEKINGEIITVDSMQAYRGLDIGTAKPTPNERQRVPHHLLDVCDLTEAFDAAQFIRLAQKTVAEIQARQRTPIFCGGTGLYFKAYLEGLGEAPASDEKLRTELEKTPFETLLKELHERDSAAYEKIDKQNPRRVIRAIEIIRLTGKKFSEQRAEWKTIERQTSESARIYCLIRQSEDLHQRINLRVDEMFNCGLVEETRQLLSHGLAENKFALQAIGYRQVVEYLHNERDLAETIELVKIRTRQFAKRQMTWFRRHGNCHWLETAADDSIEIIAKKVLAALSKTAHQSEA